jgi:ABC-type antimicrobial peptide transport system ATPase subunit
MYILKVKGHEKIPDYIQLRDEQFTLIAYFRPKRPERALKKIGLKDKEDYIKSVIEDLPYGKIQKLELD